MLLQLAFTIVEPFPFAWSFSSEWVGAIFLAMFCVGAIAPSFRAGIWLIWLIRGERPTPPPVPRVLRVFAWACVPAFVLGLVFCWGLHAFGNEYAQIEKVVDSWRGGVVPLDATILATIYLGSFFAVFALLDRKHAEGQAISVSPGFAGKARWCRRR